MNAIVAPGTQATTVPDHTQLPDKDGVPVRNSQEPWQSMLLTESLEPELRRLYPEGNYFIGQDVGIYWREADPPLLGAKAPDWYLVPDVPRLLNSELRRSYVLHRELMAPLVILEYASGDGSEERDRTPWQGKFWVYEHMIRPAFYGIYEVELGRVEVYHLVENRFEQLLANESGRFPLAPLGVELGIWQGRYKDYDLPWLRWWDVQGTLLRSDDERVDEERREKEQAQQRAERLAEKLRSLGVDPDAV
ncbi:MAG: Uma2 family endonuclease [Gemmataceae bacterium]|nr:Uma2 family endonuclease [Gemmataceae bacterium]